MHDTSIKERARWLIEVLDAEGLYSNKHVRVWMENKFRCCGDDEIIVGVSPVAALLYESALMQCGFRLQGAKTMASNTIGEFLQYEYRSDGRIPEQPPAPSIVNFTGGTWFKTRKLSTLNAFKEVADGVNTLFRRGLDADVAQELMVRSISRTVGSKPVSNVMRRYSELYRTKSTNEASTKETVFDSIVGEVKNCVDREKQKIIEKYRGTVAEQDAKREISRKLAKRGKEQVLDKVREALSNEISKRIAGGLAIELTHEKSNMMAQIAFKDSEDMNNRKRVEFERITADEIEAALQDRDWMQMDNYERKNTNAEIVAMRAGLPISLTKMIDQRELLQLVKPRILLQVQDDFENDGLTKYTKERRHELLTLLMPSALA